VPAPPSQPGTCLNWTRPDAADAAVVDCGQTHLFEQAGSVRITDQPTLPNDQQWRQLVRSAATRSSTGYLKGKLDPDGRYRIGALKPSAAKWSEGDRELRCGLQRSSQSGALFPMSGKVAESDQSDVQQPGTCLAIDGRGVGDPTDCGGAHAVETVGVVDLRRSGTARSPPSPTRTPTCSPPARRSRPTYAGGDKVIADKKLTVYWDNITEDSWKAGSAKVNCNLAALLPDRSGFAPVTGSVKGAVSVATAAARAGQLDAGCARRSSTDRRTQRAAPSSAPRRGRPAPSDGRRTSRRRRATARRPPAPLRRRCPRGAAGHVRLLTADATSRDGSSRGSSRCAGHDPAGPAGGDGQRRRAGRGAQRRDPELLGLYEGVALTERTSDYGGVLPDRITIYQDAIVDICADRDEVVREVAVTVVHEIAHHFGIDEDTLHDLGWG
jgi:hypothetical protein